MGQFFRWLLIVLVTAATYYVLTEYPKYRELSGDYVRDSEFTRLGSEDWRLTHSAEAYSVANGVLTLSSDSAKIARRASQMYLAPKRRTRFRFCGEVRYQDIVQGEKPWLLGSIVINLKNAKGEREGLVPIVSGSGTTAWRSFCRVFDVSPKVEQLEIEARLLLTTGEMQIRQLSFYEVEQRPDYEKTAYLLIGLWIVTILVAILPFLWVSMTPFGLWLGLLGIVALVLGVLAPVGVLEQMQEQALAFVPEAWKAHLVQGLQRVGYGFSSLDEGRAVSKLGHFVVFALLAFLLLLFARWRRGLSAMALLLVLPIASEVLQLFIEGRTLALLDIKMDYLGVLLGVVAAAVIRYPALLVKKIIA